MTPPPMIWADSLAEASRITSEMEESGQSFRVQIVTLKNKEPSYVIEVL